MIGMADLAAVARGGAEGASLLQNTRFEGGGGEAYGAEAIGVALRCTAPLGEAQRHLRSRRAQALVGADVHGLPMALFADVNDGWVTRLWRLGAGARHVDASTITSVPADLDMDQRGARFAFAPEAHGELDPAHAVALTALGARWLADQPAEIVAPLAHTRPLLLRAFSEGEACAALIRFQGRFPQGLGGFFAVVLIDRDETVIVIDADGRAAAERQPWTPALR